ncbi:hypothetical protein H1C71_021413, partial [Ictidomys tridecemlineatus]
PPMPPPQRLAPNATLLLLLPVEKLGRLRASRRKKPEPFSVPPENSVAQAPHVCPLVSDPFVPPTSLQSGQAHAVAGKPWTLGLRAFAWLCPLPGVPFLGQLSAPLSQTPSECRPPLNCPCSLQAQLSPFLTVSPQCLAES